MPDDVHVEVARLVDRDLVLKGLEERGYEPRVLDEEEGLAIEIPCGDKQRACQDVLAELESIVTELDVPLVPVEADGFVYLRPPGG